MPIAEGKTLDFDSPDTVDSTILETIPYKGARQRVSYSSKEFSAVCPFSGLPDIGEIRIHCIPKNCFVELKSLKYYFLSYRNVGIYQEDVTNKIYQDLSRVLDAYELTVTMIYQTRGGIDTTCVVSSKDQ